MPLAVRLLSKIESGTHPQLVIQVRLRTYANDLEPGQAAKTIQTHALIDTGATKTCICPQLLDQLGCERYELRQQRGATGTREVYQRFADIELFNDDKVVFAEFQNLKVIEFAAHDDDPIKVLLGMDLLGQFSTIQIRGFEISFGSLIA